jgi:hypothetical protein
MTCAATTPQHGQSVPSLCPVRDRARLPVQPLRPEAECLCDGATGTCRVRPGAACAAAGECASGVCGATAQATLVCCGSACSAGSFCSSDGARCIACEGTAVECAGNTERRCAAGEVVPTECPNGCTPEPAATPYRRSASRALVASARRPTFARQTRPAKHAAARGTARREGNVCSENGSCACQEGQVAAGSDRLLQNGDPCSGSQQCQPGSVCTDGVCCQEACGSACERCEPNTGLCVAIAAAQPDPACTNGRQCTGTRGDCRLTLRQPCSTLTGLCNDLLPIGTPCGTSSQWPLDPEFARDRPDRGLSSYPFGTDFFTPVNRTAELQVRVFWRGVFAECVSRPSLGAPTGCC